MFHLITDDDGDATAPPYSAPHVTENVIYARRYERQLLKWREFTSREISCFATCTRSRWFPRNELCLNNISHKVRLNANETLYARARALAMRYADKKSRCCRNSGIVERSTRRAEIRDRRERARPYVTRTYIVYNSWDTIEGEVEQFRRTGTLYIPLPVTISRVNAHDVLQTAWRTMLRRETARRSRFIIAAAREANLDRESSVIAPGEVLHPRAKTHRIE